MEKFSQLVTWVDGKVWGWGMILLLLGTHLFHDRPNRVLSREKQSQKESSFPYPKNRMQTVKSVSSEHLPLRWHLRSEPEILSVWELPLP